MTVTPLIALLLNPLVQPPADLTWAATAWGAATWSRGAATGQGPVDLAAGERLEVRLTPRAIRRIKASGAIDLTRRCPTSPDAEVVEAVEAVALEDGSRVVMQGPWGACWLQVTARAAAAVSITRPRRAPLDLLWDTTRIALEAGAPLPSVPEAASLARARARVDAVVAEHPETRRWALDALRFAWLRAADWRRAGVRVHRPAPIDGAPEAWGDGTWVRLAADAPRSFAVGGPGAMRVDVRSLGAPVDVRVSAGPEVAVHVAAPGGRAHGQPTFDGAPPGPRERGWWWRAAGAGTVRVEASGPALVRLRRGRVWRYGFEAPAPDVAPGPMTTRLDAVLRAPATRCVMAPIQGAAARWAAAHCAPDAARVQPALPEALAAWRSDPIEGAAALRSAWQATRWWSLPVADSAATRAWLERRSSERDPPPESALRSIGPGVAGQLLVPEPGCRPRRAALRVFVSAPQATTARIKLAGTTYEAPISRGVTALDWSATPGAWPVELLAPADGRVISAALVDGEADHLLRVGAATPARVAAPPTAGPIRLAVRAATVGALTLRWRADSGPLHTARVHLRRLDAGAQALDQGALTARAQLVILPPPGTRHVHVEADRPAWVRAAWRGARDPSPEVAPTSEAPAPVEDLLAELYAVGRRPGDDPVARQVAQAERLIALGSLRTRRALQAMRDARGDPRVAAIWQAGLAARACRAAWVPPAATAPIVPLAPAVRSPEHAALVDAALAAPSAAAWVRAWRATDAWRHARAAAEHLGAARDDAAALLLADGLLRRYGGDRLAPLPGVAGAAAEGTRWVPITIARAPGGMERIVHGLPVVELPLEERIAYALAAPPWSEATGQVVIPRREAIRRAPGRWNIWCAPQSAAGRCAITVDGARREIAARQPITLTARTLALADDAPLTTVLAVQSLRRGRPQPLRRSRTVFRSFARMPSAYLVEGPTTIELRLRPVLGATPGRATVTIDGPSSAPRTITVPLDSAPDPKARGQRLTGRLGRAHRHQVLLPDAGTWRVAIEPDRGELLVSARRRAIHPGEAPVDHDPSGWPRPAIVDTSAPATTTPEAWPTPALAGIPDATAAGRLGTLSLELRTWRALALEDEEAIGDTPGRDVTAFMAAWRRGIGRDLQLRAQLAVRQGQQAVFGGVAAARLGTLRLPGRVSGPGIALRLAHWRSPGAALTATRASLQVHRAWRVAAHALLIPSLRADGAWLDPVDDGVALLDPVLGGRWLRDHEQTLRAALAGRWSPVQDHLFGARLEAGSNADLASLDRVGGRLTWWGIFGLGPEATIETRLRWQPNYWFADAHRRDAGIAHRVQVGGQLGWWWGQVGRWRLRVDGGPIIDRRGGATARLDIGLGFDWTAGRALGDFTPVETRFARLAGRRFLDAEAP